MMSILAFSSAWTPMFALIIGAGFLLFFLIRFANARLLAADVAELERMRAEGILVGEPRSDYATLTYLLNTVAPAVSLRTEVWVSVYWGVLLISRTIAFRNWVDRQMKLLAAHQAKRYRVAVNRLLEMQA